MGNLEI
ncbi:hypothetical protein CRUP_029232 [Coryphaenoides rupestris]|nr:hypothetical protein CRUP_029232 [Coryphaenoides rupestris]